MSILFSPITIGQHTLNNRLVVSPMCQYSSTDGFAADWHLVHLGQFAQGKAGTIIQEATAVSPEGRITYADAGIWSDDHIGGWKKIVDYVHAQGSKIGIQLAHAGRKASTNKPWINRLQFSPDHELGWQTISSTNKGFHPKDVPPVAMTTSEVKAMVQTFKQAAARAIETGYDILEIHAAHGYLIHQFYSPLINDRTDEYGGSFENRIKFLLEIVDAIKSIITTQSLWVRISASDWAEGGWHIDESIQLTKILETRGVDVIDVSSGGGVREQKITTGPNYQVPFASKIKANTQLTVGTVGLITTAQQAESILIEGSADLIFMGRAFLKNPHLAYQFAQDLHVDIDWAPQYESGKEKQ